jgi:cation transport ATPase
MTDPGKKETFSKDLDEFVNDPKKEEPIEPIINVVSTTPEQHEKKEKTNKQQQQQQQQQQEQQQNQQQKQQQQQKQLLGLDGPITSMVKVQILGLIELLVSILMDFTAESLSRSGWIVTGCLLFFFCCSGVHGLTVFHSLYYLDVPENRVP